MHDQHATTPVHEGSMADGRDPVPKILSQQRPSESRHQALSLPQKQRPLPPLEPEHPTPTASHDMSSSFSSSTYHTPTQPQLPGPPHAYLSPPEHHPGIAQHQPAHHPEIYADQHYMAADANLVHPQAQATQGLYYPRPHEHGDGLELLIDASQQHPHMASAYDMIHTPGVTAPAGMPFFADLGPNTDGFDDQLQSFNAHGAGPADMHQSNGWMNGFQSGPLG